MTNGFQTVAVICIFILVLFFLLSCNNEAKAPELTKYYFPMDALHENTWGGLVYIYEVQIDTLANYEYWYYKAFDRNGRTFLSATQYDREGNVALLTMEEVVTNGTVLMDFRAYNTDLNESSSLTQGKIEHGDVYPFEADPSLWFVTNVKYKNPADTLEEIRWIRNRNFRGFERFFFDNDTVNVAVFDNLERFEMDHPIKGAAHPEATSVQWFAENIGLVYYEKNFENYLLIRGMLKERISMEDFLNRLQIADDKMGD